MERKHLYDELTAGDCNVKTLCGESTNPFIGGVTYVTTDLVEADCPKCLAWWTVRVERFVNGEKA